MKAVERYNDIMNWMGYEHKSIGTRFSEGTEDWNLRDMVAECDYVLATFYECGHSNYEMLNGYDGDDGIEMAKQEVQELKGFIWRYRADALKLNEMAKRHCSQYDL